MKPIYLEPDEEITSIIDRISKTSDKEIAVVVPKNSTMFQSLVNLKLLVRQAQKMGKTVAIISTNKVGSRLAKQVGLDTFSSLGTVSPQSTPATPATPVVPITDTLPDGTPIHRYVPAVGSQQDESSNLELEKNKFDSDSSSTPAILPETEPLKADHLTDQEDDEDQPLTGTDHLEAGLAVGGQSSEANLALPPIVSRQRPDSPRTNLSIARDSTFVFPWKSALVALLMLLITLTISYIFIPKATVTLTFLSKQLNETFILTAKTNISNSEGVNLPESKTGAVIGGNLLTVERTNTKVVTATGKKDIGTKASGSISIRNCEDTNSHLLAAGSKATASNKVFLTSSAVSIPAGQFSGGGTVCNSTSVAVTVSAQEAGESYNLSGASFTLAGQPSRISGSGSTAGGLTKQITVLSTDDVSNAYNELKTQINLDGINELKRKAESQTILDEAIKSTIIEQKVDKEVGSQTETATVSLTLNLYTIVFDAGAVETASKEKLATKIEPNQQLETNNKKPTVVFKELTDDKSNLFLEVTAIGFAVPNIDKNVVTKEVRHKSSASTTAFLKNKYQALDVKIEIIPGWWPKRLPITSRAIEVKFGFSEDVAPPPQ